MELDAIMQLVQNVAFPIAMCICLCVILYKKITQDADNNERFLQAINQNTSAIESLKTLVNTLHTEGG